MTFSNSDTFNPLNVEKYSVAGQNIAIMMTSEDWDRNITTSRIAEIALGWFDEYKNGGPHGWMDMINNLTMQQFNNSYVIFLSVFLVF